MDIIHLLSDHIANQIAAGEVVQRPSSVVKELLENAIDAQATSIKLIIKDSGKTLVQVIDDGQGMSITDCRMCFERHATSKISQSDDLYAIRTMGFRGEALASIAAVAQVEVRTRREADELGTQLRIEGSEFLGQEPISTAKGTNMLVRNIFFNVPARRKFLKSNSVEMKHILDEFQKVALAYPEIAFELHHNDIEMYKLVAENLPKRIVDLFGKNYRQQLAHCEEATPYVSISGFVGKPESAKKTRGDQYFFINRRFVKSNYLHHAITTAFEGTIAEGYHPFYVLNIDIDPSHIDINIHPQKTEIKFDDERAVYGILRSAVRQAIGVYNLTPSIDFESDINFGNLTNRPLPEKKPSAFERSGSSIQNFERKEPSQWKPLYEGLESAANRQESTGHISLSSKANKTAEQQAEDQDFKPETEEVDAIQIHLKYLVLQVKSGMLLIDQKAAWERILFEQYLKNLQNKSGASQQLLFQKTLELDPASFALAQELKTEIHALGFAFEIFGKSSLIIHGIPAELNDDDGAKILKDLIAQYKENETELNLNKVQNLAQSLSKRAAGKQMKVMDKREIRAMINRLFESSLPNYTPDGQKVMKIIPLAEIAELISKSNGF
ncbi:DNA mismatch repair endonuclease MutL [Marinilongibacter aquaticus]|uniref:DNA mismatch repair endonuclease MutL n=1 Tax=Marinilongibacter aquaticus TaxID=2975157 RepID=UPI0021BD7C35|nr:DNA mismatch repair endonuclease MutL [Marinilongibacter aquaticus]UBM57457.1 DNA mismatch repair endonuclease MutL [Marinilongibacter aquaticus]